MEKTRTFKMIYNVISGGTRLRSRLRLGWMDSMKMCLDKFKTEIRGREREKGMTGEVL